MMNERPNMTTIMNQMILEVVNGCIFEIEAKLKNDILVKNNPILTVDDVVKITGLKRSSVYNYMNDGLISYYKLNNKKVYFKIEDINNFIFNKKNYCKAKNELKQEALKEYLKHKE